VDTAELAGFLAKRVDNLGILGKARDDDLDRVFGSEFDVVCEVDLTHAASSYQLEDDVGIAEHSMRGEGRVARDSGYNASLLVIGVRERGQMRLSHGCPGQP